jgi:hypothetical protein
MIRRPHDEEPFRTSSTPTQLVDPIPDVDGCPESQTVLCPDGRSIYALQPRDDAHQRDDISRRGWASFPASTRAAARSGVSA